MDYTAILENLRTISNNPNFFIADVATSAVSFVSSPGGILFLIVKILFILFSVALLAALAYILAHTNYLKYRLLQDVVEFFTYKPYGVKKMTKGWVRVVNRLEMPDSAEHKLALIEADDIVDNILRRMGYAGNDLGERLAHLTAMTLPNLNQLTQAHQVRNNIVHDPDYHLTLDQARKTLEVYEAALKDLQALE